jgi:uridine kinase
MNSSIKDLANKIFTYYQQHKSQAVFSIAISGIDASGKGYIAKGIKYLLEEKGLNIALLSIDDWQMPKSISLLQENAAENFYYNSFRWAAFFDSLFLPLQKDKSISLKANLVNIKNDKVYAHEYHFEKIDTILVEGIFLLKKDLQAFFDYKVWIDCSFETGIQRALQRNQEGLSPEQLIYDYQTYYYPAQEFHFKKDRPKAVANYIINNND